MWRCDWDKIIADLKEEAKCLNEARGFVDKAYNATGRAHKALEETIQMVDSNIRSVYKEIANSEKLKEEQATGSGAYGC